MRPRKRAATAGLTLLEVLVAMGILLIGVTYVLILFPVGVRKVHHSVLDTRCTILANSAWQIVDTKELTRDPLHLDPRPEAVALATLQGNPPHVNGFLQTPWNFNYAGAGNYFGFDQDIVKDTTPNKESYYLRAMTDNVGTIPGAPVAPETQLGSRLTGGTVGVPLLIDPLLVHAINNGGATTNALDFQASRQTPIPVDNYTAMVSAAAVDFRALRAVTSWESASIGNPDVREAYNRRWFGSPDDPEFREELAGVPLAPGAAAANIVDPGAIPVPLAATSARRDLNYSWAVLTQSTVDSTGASISSISANAILVFYKRNLAKPFVNVAGCFVNGDSRMTLAYQTAQGKPTLRRGSWLVEMTIHGRDPGTGALGTYDSAVDIVLHRRTVKFHRIKDYEDVTTDVGTVRRILVTLEDNPSGYLVGPRPTFPDILPVAMPAAAPPAYNAGTPIYFPIVIFDGLQEVYSRTGVMQ